MGVTVKMTRPGRTPHLIPRLHLVLGRRRRPGHSPRPLRPGSYVPARPGDCESRQPWGSASSPTRTVLDADSALDLMIANTSPGQVVADLDADPMLRRAAQVTRCRYHAVQLDALDEAVPAQQPEADLVVLAWPRPDHPTGRNGQDALHFAAGLLAPGGHVTLILRPSVADAFCRTWTGQTLDAAAGAGLTYLQSVLCLHAMAPDPRDDPGGVDAVARRPGRLRSRRAPGAHLRRRRGVHRGEAAAGSSHRHCVALVLRTWTQPYDAAGYQA